MRILRCITYNVTVLNVLLSIVLTIGVIYFIIPVTRMNQRFVLPRVNARAPLANEAIAEASGPLQSDYAIIGEMNLFHPQRTVPVEKKAEQPKPELILYGTIADGSTHVAFIEDKKNPKSSPGRGNRQTAIKKGDIISGFTVTEIEPARIILKREDEQIIVPLSVAEKRKGSHGPAATGQSQPKQGPIPPGQRSAPRPPVPATGR